MFAFVSIQSLLHLLDEKVKDSISLPLCATDCLIDLCDNIHRRLLAAFDVTFHCPDPGTVAVNL